MGGILLLSGFATLASAQEGRHFVVAVYHPADGTSGIEILTSIGHAGKRGAFFPGPLGGGGTGASAGNVGL